MKPKTLHSRLTYCGEVTGSRKQYTVRALIHIFNAELSRTENGRRGGIIGRHAATTSRPLHQFLLLQKRPVQYILLIYIL